MDGNGWDRKSNGDTQSAGCSVFGARSFIVDTVSVGIHCDGNEGQRVMVKMGNGHEAQRAGNMWTVPWFASPCGGNKECGPCNT